jgi:hypothetical protein
MPGRRQYTNKKELQKLSKEQLIAKVENAQFTIASRGKRIGALYHTVQCLMNNHPDAVLVQRVAEDKSVIESLKTQLTQARTLAQQAMEARDQAVANQGSPRSSASGQHHDCVVCYREFDGDECRPVALNCGHILCEECCLKQEERTATCPKCRREFVSFLPLFF